MGRGQLATATLAHTRGGTYKATLTQLSSQIVYRLHASPRIIVTTRPSSRPQSGPFVEDGPASPFCGLELYSRGLFYSIMQLRWEVLVS
jgi:hypothetical protein